MLKDLYLKQACEMCENHSVNSGCEDRMRCPVYSLYLMVDEQVKTKVVDKRGWETPPNPRPEMI